jgi:hypothetical protein
MLKTLAVSVLASLCLGCGAVSGPGYTPSPKHEMLWRVKVAICPSQPSAPKASPNLRPLPLVSQDRSTSRTPTFSEDSPWYGSQVVNFQGTSQAIPLTFSEFSQRYGCALARRGFGSIEPGGTLQLGAITYPVGHADDLGRRLGGSEVTSRSLDTSIATVDSNGLVTGIRPGEVLISIRCNICPLLPDYFGFGAGLAEYLGPRRRALEKPQSPASSQAR